jgi:SagB-type dehydrogenase family enzyme
MLATNMESSAARRYHEDTKHSRQSLRVRSRTADPDNKPFPYKTYCSLPTNALPSDFQPSAMSTLDALAVTPAVGTFGERVPDAEALARLCFFSNGILRQERRAGAVRARRPAACTGALYHLELYIVCADLPRMPAGVYHFGVAENGFQMLRRGDFRKVLVEATSDEPAVATAPAVVICTSMPWRNAWKYGTRAYRHIFWDAGTVLANLMAVSAALELPAKIVLGFADELVSQLLGLDSAREFVVALVPAGRWTRTTPPASTVAPLDLFAVPASPAEASIPAIRAVHAASTLRLPDEVANWRGAPPRETTREPHRPLFPLQPAASTATRSDPVEAVICRRGSARSFSPLPLSYEQLSTMLCVSTHGMAADYLEPSRSLLCDLYLTVHGVEGLSPGTYVLRRSEQALELLRSGDFREVAGRMALDQALGAQAAVNVYFLADLAAAMARFGNRGYRAAQLTAAVTAGKLYLAAYALGLGATGLTFFDDEVTAFFSPQAADRSVMFLLALGSLLR